MYKPSKIFVGYRALGFVSNHVPLSLRYILRRKENLVVTVIGKSFHTYGCSKLSLLSVSNPHPEEIDCLASDSYLVFTACKNVIFAWKRGIELKHVYKGHDKDVHILLPFGPHLLSVDENSTIVMWDIKSEDNVLEMSFSNSSFCITTLMHPSTYLNKILIGSKQGSMQLWNLRRNKLLYEFAGWQHPITVIEQAPAVNVVAVGLASGDIYIHNLRHDCSIMKFSQDWGPVTAISFRTDGSPIMATASNIGHIAIWDLEKKRLQNEIRSAHRASVTGMKFLPNEPLLITSSPDNSLKMWIFDMFDGSGRLLRLREGHCNAPLKIHFHGSSGKNIISAGLDSTLRSFSTAADNMNKNLGQASYNRKIAKKKGIKNDPGILPPIVNFTAETTREKEWDNIAACHRGLGMVTTWTYDHCRMGEHKLLHERFMGKKDIRALCVTLSACGNFVLIGYNTGHIDMFNIQSGLFRGTYGGEKAHDASVHGIVSDSLNQITVSGGSDKLLKFWKFKEKTLIVSIKLQSVVSLMISHRESSMTAVALDDFSVIIVDQETKKIVRSFDEHGGKIVDMTFSPDSRWLMVASMDSIIRTWDLPTGSLIDSFRVSPMCISMSMSPTGEYLATVHTGDLGIYLWSNSTLYSHISLHPLPSNYEPSLMNLPMVSLEGKSSLENDSQVEEIESTEDEIPEFKSPEQISDQLVTLSMLPHSHWQNLLHLDIIKLRNKPKEPPTVPKNAPFFLPVVSGLKPTFFIDENPDLKDEGHSQLLKVMQNESPFFCTLRKCSENDNYTPVLDGLKSMNPSAIDAEVRCLLPENGGSIELMLAFMKAVKQGLDSNKDFELIQIYLALFLKIHSEKIMSSEILQTGLSELKQSQRKSWQLLRTKFNESICLVKFLRSAVLK